MVRLPISPFQKYKTERFPTMTETQKTFEWLNKDSLKFLSEGYLQEGEDALTRIRNICDSAEKILGIKGFSDRFYGHMSKGWVCLSSPIWSNFGTNRGLPISCNGNYFSDTMESIIGKVAEVGMQTKSGAGTSSYMGKLRARGTKISTGGISFGPVHFMEMLETTTNIISQSNVRRGSCAVYLDVEHPDIMEFLNCREEGSHIHNLSLGVCIGDDWMRSMIDGDKDKRKIWARIIKKRFESGYPYLFFTDNVNSVKPQVYYDKNLKIHASNLCVAGMTDINILDTSTNEYHTIEIQDLGEYLNKNVDIKVLSFNHKTNQVEYNKITNFALMNESAECLSLSDSTGEVFLECTPDHKIYSETQMKYVYAKDLNEDDYVIVLGDNNELKFAYIKNYLKHQTSHTVYDITVENVGNFFANGILVHNCNEIMLPSSEDESFVCNLAAVNDLFFDDWKDTSLIEDMVYFLDAVMSEYIEKTANIKFMEASHNFAKNHRAIGIGRLGWHSYLQSKMIPFESLDAKLLNTKIQKKIWEDAQHASSAMAQEFGEPSLLKGYNKRHTTLLAIAPTTSSSFILGQVSPSIEPLNSNYFVKNLAKGKFTYKNPYLKEVLKTHHKNDSETWESILVRGGSVQHLSFLSEHEKDVFKTFGEISQMEIIIQAAARQKYIDQGQSLNTMIHPDTSLKDVNNLLIKAWELGIKGLYYQRSSNPAQELVRNLTTCKSCEV